MEEKILNILRSYRDTFISGEQLCRRLDISKAMLIKFIHQLRTEGYAIERQPHLGYRLVALPDRLISRELSWRLSTKVIGRRILSYHTVDSTNTVAFSLAEQDAFEGTAVFAEAQKRGKGRWGRSWVSPRSKGIYLSLILRPKTSPQDASLITLLAAVSVAEAIRRVCALPAQIRWPNDILVNKKKVCGILTEMQVQDKNRVKFIVLGIGINVNTPRSKLPAEASSLQEEAKTYFSRLELARQLLRQLDREYLVFKQRGSKSLIGRWRNLSFLSGKRVKVYLARETIEGQAQDIDSHGALIVRLDCGFKKHIMAAEVVRVR